MMRECPTCGAPQIETVGSVTLKRMAITLDGVRIRECDNGHREEGYPAIGKAMDLAADLLIAKPWALSPGEFRSLRTHAGLRGKELAAILGVAPESVSRWELGKMTISPLADRAIRLVATHGRADVVELADLAGVDAGRNEPLEATLRWDGRGWVRVVAEAAA